MEYTEFSKNMADMGFEVHENAVKKGFYDFKSDTPGCLVWAQKLALVHCEVSEAMEAVRDSFPLDKHLPQFDSFEVELADIVIRVMDLACATGSRLGEAIVAKHQFNQTRIHKHGKEC